jgi:SOS response regulatory protein OraA/RecX
VTNIFLKQFNQQLNQAIDECVLAEGLASRLFKTVMKRLESPDAAMKKRVQEELKRLVDELINKWHLEQERTGLDLTDPLNMQRFLVQQGFISTVVSNAVKQIDIDPDLGNRAKRKLLRQLFVTVIKLNNQELFKKQAQVAKQREKAKLTATNTTNQTQNKTTSVRTRSDNKKPGKINVDEIEQAIQKLDDTQRSELVANLLKQYAQARKK